jgi:hypothetical protein
LHPLLHEKESLPHDTIQQEDILSSVVADEQVSYPSVVTHQLTERRTSGYSKNKTVCNRKAVANRT